MHKREVLNAANRDATRRKFLEVSGIVELPNLQVLHRMLARPGCHGGLFLKLCGPKPFSHPAETFGPVDEGNETFRYTKSESFGGRPYVYPEPKTGKLATIRMDRGKVTISRQISSSAPGVWTPAGQVILYGSTSCAVRPSSSPYVKPEELEVEGAYCLYQVGASSHTCQTAETTLIRRSARCDVFYQMRLQLKQMSYFASEAYQPSFV